MPYEKEELVKPLGYRHVKEGLPTKLKRTQSVTNNQKSTQGS